MLKYNIENIVEHYRPFHSCGKKNRFLRSDKQNCKICKKDCYHHRSVSPHLLAISHLNFNEILSIYYYNLCTDRERFHVVLVLITTQNCTLQEIFVYQVILSLAFIHMLRENKYGVVSS